MALQKKMLLATTARPGHFLTNQGPLYAHLVQREHFPKHMQLHANHGEFVLQVHISCQGTNSSDRACSFCQKGKFTSANSQVSVRYGELAQEENSFHKRVLQH